MNGNKTKTLVLLCKPRFPSNVGGIIRSCALLGADGLIIATDEEEKLRSRAEHVGMLNRHEYVLQVKWVPLSSDLSTFWHSMVTRIRASEYHITCLEQPSVMATPAAFSTSAPPATTSCPIQLLPQQRAHCFVFGSEDSGVPEEMLELTDTRAHVPQTREQSSLNVAHTVSICLWERARWMEKAVDRSAAAGWAAPDETAASLPATTTAAATTGAEKYPSLSSISSSREGPG